MKIKLFLICFIFIFMSCQFGSLTGSDTITGSDQNSSVLSGIFSKNSVLAPKNIKKDISIAQGKYNVRIFWDSVPNVNKYIVEVSKITYVGEERKSEIIANDISVDVPEYIFIVDLQSSETMVERDIRIKSINVNSKESLYSAIFNLKIDKNQSYNETIAGAYLSRGTKNTIEIVWSRAKEADYYVIDRQQSGYSESRVTVNKIFLPSSADKPQYVWSDNSAKPGYVYDYIIIPVNMQGIRGVEKLAELGFYMPKPENVVVSSGSSVFSADDKKTVLDIEFELINRFRIGNGDFITEISHPDLFPKLSPKNIDIYIGLKASNVLVSGKSAVNLPETDVSSPANNLDYLTKLTDAQSWAIPAGYQKKVIGQLSFYYKGDLATDEKISYLYRVVVNKSSTPEEHFTVPYYTILNIKYDLNSNIPMSSISFGWITSDINKGATSIQFLKQVAVDDGGTAKADLEWESVAGATKYFVYKKKFGEGGWSLASADLTVPSLKVEIDKNVDYNFGISYTKDANDYNQSRILVVSDTIRFKTGE